MGIVRVIILVVEVVVVEAAVVGIIEVGCRTFFLANDIFLTVGRVGSSTSLIVQRVKFVRKLDKRSHLMDLLHNVQVENRVHGHHSF